MKIFLSWSGDTSKQLATFLKTWIEQIIQASEPWISADIEKGKQWNDEIVRQLNESKVGIICLTKDNLNSPWILFEAGALSKSTDSYVCTLLLDITPTDVSTPLSTFQSTNINKSDIHKLLSTINDAIGKSGGKSLNGDTLKSLFETFYPRLEEEVAKIIESNKSSQPKQIRSDRELLEEVVIRLRKISEGSDANLLEKEAHSILDAYAQLYADLHKLEDKWYVGTEKNIDDFLRLVNQNELLLRSFNGETGLKKYIQRVFDGLPF